MQDRACAALNRGLQNEYYKSLLTYGSDLIGVCCEQLVHLSIVYTLHLLKCNCVLQYMTVCQTCLNLPWNREEQSPLSHSRKVQPWTCQVQTGMPTHCVIAPEDRMMVGHLPVALWLKSVFPSASGW